LADETGNSVRITNAQVYEKLMEINSVQIEMVAELRNLKHLPEKVNELDNRLGKVELIAKLVYGVYGAVISAVAITLISRL
jgi:predicted CoA-binding protein